MPNLRTSPLSRRGLLAAGGVVGLGAVLAACGDGDAKSSASGSGAEKSGPWSFKDDRGQTREAESAPKNIVAFIGVAAALHDYGVEVKGVFGPTKTNDGKADVQAGDLDVSKVEVLGNVWGEFNVEKYAGLAPDLLVTAMCEKDALWYVPDESKDKILKLAPSVALWAAQTTVAEADPAPRGPRRVPRRRRQGQEGHRRQGRFEKAAARLRAAAKSQPEHQGHGRLGEPGPVLRLPRQDRPPTCCTSRSSA